MQDQKNWIGNRLVRGKDKYGSTKANGKFREGDHVEYTTADLGGTQVKRKGVITSIERDGIYIQRDNTSLTDWKSAVELKKI